MSIDTVLSGAADTIVNILTTGNPRRVLGPDDKVALLQDHDPVKGLSPAYTEHIAGAIARWQQDHSGRPNVVVHSFPQQRPLTADNPLPPQLAADIAAAQFVIGTYGALDEATSKAEEALMYKGFLDPTLTRTKASDFKTYVVAARPVLSVLELLADAEEIGKARNLALAVKRYFEDHRGEQMRVYTDNALLRLRVPTAYPIIADAFEIGPDPVLNIPGSEAFFAPELESVEGEIVLTQGSYHHLTTPVKGRVSLCFRKGRVVEWYYETGADEMVADHIAQDFKHPENRALAEFAVATFLAAAGIPVEDLRYQRTVLEKIHWHMAWGRNDHFGGPVRDAKVHIDTSFTYGNVYVGKDRIICDGLPNVALFTPYMR